MDGTLKALKAEYASEMDRLALEVGHADMPAMLKANDGIQFELQHRRGMTDAQQANCRLLARAYTLGLLALSIELLERKGMPSPHDPEPVAAAAFAGGIDPEEHDVPEPSYGEACDPPPDHTPPAVEVGHAARPGQLHTKLEGREAA